MIALLRRVENPQQGNNGLHSYSGATRPFAKVDTEDAADLWKQAKAQTANVRFNGNRNI